MNYSLNCVKPITEVSLETVNLSFVGRLADFDISISEQSFHVVLFTNLSL